MKNGILKILALILILYTSYFSFVTTAQAQSSIPLMVMPARQVVEVDPGEKKVMTFNFYNQSDDPITGFFQASDFIVQDNNGTPKLIENPADAPVKYAASNWFSLLYDRATLPAHDKVSVQAAIDVPSDAHPGGRYVAVFFEQGNNVARNNGRVEEVGVGTSSRIVSLVYIKVKGQTSEKALVSRFFTTSFYEYGPIVVDTDILNRGDYHINPNGVLSLSNMFGGLIDQVRLKSQNVFPDTYRSYKNELGSKWMMGRYKVDLTAAYGEKGQALVASTYVWVFPWRVAAVIILTITVAYLALSNLFKNLANKESSLEAEIAKEKEEIEKLKEALRKKRE
ncbi:MAG: hypothetical protein ACOYUB_00055 [Patescibacteria group bacterium]